MKKIIIGIVSVLIVIASSVALMKYFMSQSHSDNNPDMSNTEEKEIEPKEEESKEGYEILVSQKDMTIEKGTEASFDITFTNPDESSIREYITCQDQNDIILVKYSNLEDNKITVEVEALKEGSTEIVVCDFNYPDRKEIVKVNVLETNNILKNQVTQETAFEGVNNYCHSEYDWSVAEGNPEMMYVVMGEESETEYQVKFRSYTGAFVYFFVDKNDGNTRMVEYVPELDIEEEVGTINVYDYLKKY